MYGWKGRIALILPSRNTTTEPEFQRLASEGVSIHATRVELNEASPVALGEMEEGIYQAASLMMSVGPDLIVVACTSGTLIKGVGYDRKMSDRITELTNVPAITTAGAVLEALSLLKVTKVAMATPYIDEVNEKEKQFLEGNGIRVTKMKGLGYSKSGALYPLISRPVSMIGLLYPEVAYKLAFDVDTPDAEGIFISCTNFRTIEIIAALEKNAGKPVVTSNQATWAIALRRLGIKEKIGGFGKLLELPE